MEFERTRPKKISVGVIPLIDVAMFLLIFFMVAGSIDKLEIVPIEPPLAESGKLLDEGHISILLGSRDEIVVNDELVDMEKMQDIVRESLSSNPNKIITVKADATIPASRMIQLMDRIKAVGGKNLSIMTQSTGDKNAAPTQ